MYVSTCQQKNKALPPPPSAPPKATPPSPTPNQTARGGRNHQVAPRPPAAPIGPLLLLLVEFLSSHHGQVAACGTCGDSLKICNACKTTKYCSRDCQLSHWSIHKAECRMRVAEKALDKKLSETPAPSDEELFQQPPAKEECPICFLRLPLSPRDILYMSCCGQLMCSGCVLAHESAEGDPKCPFCRNPNEGEEAYVQRIRERVKSKDAEATFRLGWLYVDGPSDRALQMNEHRGFELLFQAAELGSIDAHAKLAAAYMNGDAVLEKDVKKGARLLQIAAIGGNDDARSWLGQFECPVHNHYFMNGGFNGDYTSIVEYIREEGSLDRMRSQVERSMKHYMISASAGNGKSLDEVRSGFEKGMVTKEDFEGVLRAHEESSEETKSEQRELACERAEERERAILESQGRLHLNRY